MKARDRGVPVADLARAGIDKELDEAAADQDWRDLLLQVTVWNWLTPSSPLPPSTMN